MGTIFPQQIPNRSVNEGYGVRRWRGANRQAEFLAFTSLKRG